MKTIPIFIVTRNSSDRTVKVGDKVYYSPNGDLNLICKDGGWIDAEDLTPEITDFEYVIDQNKEVVIDNRRRERIVAK